MELCIKELRGQGLLNLAVCVGETWELQQEQLAARTNLKPRWDVHLSGDDDQLGYAGESLSSVLGE